MSPACFGCQVNNSWNPNPVPVQPTAPLPTSIPIFPPIPDVVPPFSPTISPFLSTPIEWGEPPTIGGPIPIFQPKPENGLTDEELQVLYHLREAWNAFFRLEKHREMDQTEFLDSIHKTQQIIALRVARRVNPEIWIQPE